MIRNAQREELADLELGDPFGKALSPRYLENAADSDWH
jgi:hypothetical protein